MADKSTPKATAPEEAFNKAVASKLARKMRAVRGRGQGVWFGLGMFGLIGWSVAVPTLLGAMIGLWWDKHHLSTHSWTLALLIAGLVVGCANAWRWIAQEDAAMHDSSDDSHD